MADAPPPRAVVFDIGNVLIEWNPERFFDTALGQDGRKALFDAVDLHAMNLEVDRGEDFTGAVERLAARHPIHADHIRLWRTNWLDMASPEIPHSVRLLRALKSRGVPVFALTNFGIETFRIARAAYPFLDEFDRAWVSGHMGLIKPDPAIYAALERDSGLAPGSLLFTDDRPENIAAARARGWRTHLFDGPAGWAQVLVDAGLMTEKEAR